MPGALFNGQCFPSAYEAAKAQCSQVHGVTQAGAVECLSVTGTALQPTLRLVITPASGDVIERTQLVQFSDCDPMEPYTDLSTMFGLMLVATVAVWMMKQFVLRLVMPQ